MEILNFSSDEYRSFILILIRVSIILYMFPVFSSPTFPTMAKTGLALVISLMLFPAVTVDPDIYPFRSVDFGILIFCEFVVGMAMGYTIKVFFAAVQLAGQIVGFQMGFAMINVIDPQTGSNISMMSQISYLLVILLFILMRGHHIILTALVDSFSIVNIGSIWLKPQLLEQLRTLITGMFVLGIKMSAPAMAALIFTDAAFGITAKFVPQMHILIVAFPVKIAIGLVMFASMLTIIRIMTINYMGTFRALLTSIMVWLGG